MPKPDLPQLLPNNKHWWPGDLFLAAPAALYHCIPFHKTLILHILRNNSIVSREDKDTTPVVKAMVDRDTTQEDRMMVDREMVDKAITQEVVAGRGIIQEARGTSQEEEDTVTTLEVGALEHWVITREYLGPGLDSTRTS